MYSIEAACYCIAMLMMTAGSSGVQTHGISPACHDAPTQPPGLHICPFRWLQLHLRALTYIGFAALDRWNSNNGMYTCKVNYKSKRPVVFIFGANVGFKAQLHADRDVVGDQVFN